MKKNDDFYVSFFTSRPFSPAYRQFACLARQEACLSRSAGAAGLPVSLGRGGGLACLARQGRRACAEFAITLSPRLPCRRAILGASNPQNRGERFRKFFRGEFSEAFPSNFARLTAPPQSKADFFLTNSRDFGGVEPPKSLGENSCFPLKPFSACYRVLHGFAVSRSRGV